MSVILFRNKESNFCDKAATEFKKFADKHNLSEKQVEIISVDKSIVKKYQIKMVPTLIAFAKNKKEIARKEGIDVFNKFEEFVKQNA